MLWWQKLIIIVVISIFVVGCILGGLAIYTSVEAKEATTSVETTAVETTVEEATIETETSLVEETEETVIPEGVIPEPYESEGGLPTSESIWIFDVSPNEIEVLSGGPASINGVDLPGGANPDRGSVIIMLPADNKVISYKVTSLVPGANWHGSYKYGRVPTEADWQALRDDRIQAMFTEPNGSLGKGCKLVDVLVVKGNDVIFQKTYEK